MTVGTCGAAIHDTGCEVPGSPSSTTQAYPLKEDGQQVPREELPVAWWRFMMREGGRVVLDNRPCEGLRPVGVWHDDAPVCETGISPWAPDQDGDLDDSTNSDSAPMYPVGETGCTSRSPAGTVHEGASADRQEQE